MDDKENNGVKIDVTINNTKPKIDTDGSQMSGGEMGESLLNNDTMSNMGDMTAGDDSTQGEDISIPSLDISSDNQTLMSEAKEDGNVGIIQDAGASTIGDTNNYPETPVVLQEGTGDVTQEVQEIGVDPVISNQETIGQAAVAATPIIEAPVAAGNVVIEPPKKKKGILKSILIIFVAWLIVAGPVMAYLWRDKQASDQSAELQAQIETLKSEKAELQSQIDSDSERVAGACDEIQPSDSAMENIKASITSANTQPLEGYMASGVDVILAASEGLGESTPAVAVENITSFIANSGTWSFVTDEATIESYSNGDYSDYFASNSLIAKSTTNKVLVFTFDCSAKIGTVLIVSSDSLL